MEERPFVSIVIPTHNRSEQVKLCLAALAQQTYPADRYEVIVVADGCTDGTATDLNPTEYAFRLVTLAQAQAGAGVARNRGATGARGVVLLFIDDDVIASSQLVEAHARAHSQTDGLVAMGPYLLDKPQPGDYLSEQLYEYWIRLFGKLEDPNYQIHSGNVVAGNLSMTAATFAAAGGFDVKISGALEDHEFGIRLLKYGARFVFLPEARARHLETTDLDHSLQRSRRAGRAAVRMVDLHPSTLRSTKLFRQKTVMRTIAFRARSLDIALGTCLTCSLSFAERLRMKGAWLHLFGAARTFWYWRGVADMFATESLFSAWRDHAASRLGQPPGEVVSADNLSGAAQPTDTHAH